MTTLKEKFRNLFKNHFQKGKEEELLLNAVDDDLEKIADDYAMDILRGYISNKTLQFQQSQGFHSLEQLLLIIKKENGYD